MPSPGLGEEPKFSLPTTIRPHLFAFRLLFHPAQLKFTNRVTAHACIAASNTT